MLADVVVGLCRAMGIVVAEALHHCRKGAPRGGTTFVEASELRSAVG